MTDAVDTAGRAGRLLNTYADAILTWSEQHPMLSLGIAITLLWASHKTILKPALALPKTLFEATTEKLADQAGQGRRKVDDSTKQDEEDFRRERGHGVFVGAMASVLFVGIAGLGLFLNYNLVAQPFRSIFSGVEDFIPGIPNYVIAAIAILVLEFAAGAALMSALGHSNLIKVRASGQAKSIPWAVIAGGFLLVLTVGEVLLAFERERLMEIEQQTTQILQGEDLGTAPPIDAETAAPALEGSVIEQTQENLRGLPTIIQAILGFCVPWLLLLAVTPVEGFLQVLPIILKRLTTWLLFAVELVLKWPPMLIVFVLGLFEKLLELIQKPAEIFYGGMGTLSQRIFPSIFGQRGA
jgi:hypothetical protein